MAVISNLYEAKANLSQLVDRAAAGEEIIIAKNGVPLARLMPLEPRPARRVPGGWEHGVKIADDFDAPLPPSCSRRLARDPRVTARYARLLVVANQRAPDNGARVSAAHSGRMMYTPRSSPIVGFGAALP
jgi:prevent-host-death family protein